MRTGIYGGSFSPPHIGHYAAAMHFKEAAKLDRLYIMPSLISPHKKTAKNDDPCKRLQMLKLAFADQPDVFISDHEIKQGGVSYTYLTLKEFYKDEDTLCFLTGSDMFLSLDSWREPETIFSLCEVWCCSREGDDKEALDNKAREYTEKFGARCFVCDNDAVVVSSTQVRKLLMFGDPTNGLISDDVRQYILENDLYGGKNYYIKEYIKNNLSEKRYKHSLNVAKEAADIGQALGLPEADIVKLIRAGYLHDCAKELDFEKQFDIIREFGETPDEDYIKAKQTVHQLSSAYLSKKLFDIDREVFDMIQYHCTGSDKMSLFDKIIFLSDFIEPGREYESCKKTRAAFHSAPITEEHINKTFFTCCEQLVKHLEEKGLPVNGRTLQTYKAEVKKMAENEKMKDLKNASSEEIAEEVKNILDEKLAKGIEIIPVRDKTVVTDYFVICNATSTTHVKALTDEVEVKLEEAGLSALHTDGLAGGEWSVLDYGVVIVHIFTKSAREFYKLDKLWQDKTPDTNENN